LAFFCPRPFFPSVWPPAFARSLNKPSPHPATSKAFFRSRRPAPKSFVDHSFPVLFCPLPPPLPWPVPAEKPKAPCRLRHPPPCSPPPPPCKHGHLPCWGPFSSLFGNLATNAIPSSRASSPASKLAFRGSRRRPLTPPCPARPRMPRPDCGCFCWWSSRTLRFHAVPSRGGYLRVALVPRGSVLHP